MGTARLLIVTVLTVASAASADVGSTFELGYVRSRTAVTDVTALDGESLRFAFRVFGRYLHVGAEAEEGRLTGTTHLPEGAVARATSGVEGPLGGNVLALRLVAGADTRVKWLGLGASVAVGRRDSWVSSDAGMDVAGRMYEPLLEARTRADVWLTPGLTLGAVASTDLIERRNVALGVVVALHVGR